MRIENRKKMEPLLAGAIERAMNSHVGREEAGYFVSVTQLLNPPQQVILRWRNGKNIVRDAMECVDLFIGTAVHEFIHQHSLMSGYKGLSEERYKVEILGKIVSGGLDNAEVQENGKLWIKDYKVVKSYAAGLEDKWPDWEAQLNMYGYMATESGEEVEKLSIIPIIKDYSPKQAGTRIKDYKTGGTRGHHPKEKVNRIDFPVWSSERTRTFMEKRVQRLIDADKRPSDMLPECSPEDTWSNRRCNEYCDVKPFCHQCAKRIGKKVK